jgi:hypothetical protein
MKLYILGYLSITPSSRNTSVLYKAVPLLTEIDYEIFYIYIDLQNLPYICNWNQLSWL